MPYIHLVCQHFALTGRLEAQAHSANDLTNCSITQHSYCNVVDGQPCPQITSIAGAVG